MGPLGERAKSKELEKVESLAQVPLRGFITITVIKNQRVVIYYVFFCPDERFYSEIWQALTISDGSTVFKKVEVNDNYLIGKIFNWWHHFFLIWHEHDLITRKN